MTDVTANGTINPSTTSAAGAAGGGSPLATMLLTASLLSAATTPQGVDVDKLVAAFRTAAAADPHTAFQSIGQLLQQLTPVEQGAFLAHFPTVDGGDAPGATPPTSPEDDLSGAVLPKFHIPVLVQPPADPAPVEVKDQAVKTWLDTLGTSVSQGDKNQLAQTANDAQLLKSFFDAHKRGDPALNKPPQDVADAEQRLLSNPSISRQIHAGPSVTRDALGSFITKMDDAAKNATKSFQAFQKNNKAPDAVSLRMAADASIMQANLPIIDAASPGAKIDGLIDRDDVQAVAAAADSLPAPLVAAAKVYANGSEFSALDTAGGTPGLGRDGLVNNKNFDGFLATQASGADTISRLEQDATQRAIEEAGGDAKHLDADSFNDLSKSSGADKAAALVQLTGTLAKYDRGVETWQQDGNIDMEHPVYADDPAGSPGAQRDKFRADIVDKINKLNNDPDVQSFMKDKVQGALQGMLDDDPGLRTAAGQQYKAATSTQALEAAFNAKDDKGDPVSARDALTAFGTTAQFYAQAVGVAPAQVKHDLEAAFGGASDAVRKKVDDAYGDVTSGKQIDDLIKLHQSVASPLTMSASNLTANDAIAISLSDLAVYDMVLPKDRADAGDLAFNEAAAKVSRADIADGMSEDEMLKGLGFSGVDDPALAGFIESHVGDLTVPGQPAVKASDVLSMLRSEHDIIRQGTKFDDGMGKLAKGEGAYWSKTPVSDYSDSYKSGLLHATSALLLAGAMAARLGQNGGKMSPKDDLQTGAQVLQTAGLLTEGGAKAYIEAMKANPKNNEAALKAEKNSLVEQLRDASHDTNSLSSDQVKSMEARVSKISEELKRIEGLENTAKNIEAGGKLMGGVVGGAAAAGLGIWGAIDAAKSGDKVAAGLQGTSAGIAGLQVLSNMVEVGGQFAKDLTGVIVGSTLRAAAPAISGALGVAGAVVGFAFGLYSAIKMGQAADAVFKDQGDWYKQVQSDLAPFGISTPSQGALTAPADGTPEIDGGASYV